MFVYTPTQTWVSIFTSNDFGCICTYARIHIPVYQCVLPWLLLHSVECNCAYLLCDSCDHIQVHCECCDIFLIELWKVVTLRLNTVSRMGWLTEHVTQIHWPPEFHTSQWVNAITSVITNVPDANLWSCVAGVCCHVTPHTVVTERKRTTTHSRAATICWLIMMID